MCWQTIVRSTQMYDIHLLLHLLLYYQQLKQQLKTKNKTKNKIYNRWRRCNIRQTLKNCCTTFTTKYQESTQIHKNRDTKHSAHTPPRTPSPKPHDKTMYASKPAKKKKKKKAQGGKLQ